jgi:acetyl-CoA carboxylase beta subunit
VLEHGFLDLIIERRDLKQRLGDILRLLMKQDCTPLVKNALD